MLWPYIPPEQMTSRARWYLIIVTGYCLFMAYGLFFYQDWFRTANLAPVIDMIPFQLTAWGVIHTVIGALAFYAAYKGSGSAAYQTLIAAFVIVGLWAFGFVWAAGMAIHTGNKAGWSGAVVYTSLALTHLVQARQPIRSPFDPIMRSVEKSG